MGSRRSGGDWGAWVKMGRREGLGECVFGEGGPCGLGAPPESGDGGSGSEPAAGV